MSLRVISVGCRDFWNDGIASRPSQTGRPGGSMKAQKLGKQGPEISVVGFGAWEAGGDMWGPNESEDQVIEAIRAGLEAGMTWIDTAEVYGDGTSEELVARAIQGRRHEIVIGTKVAPRPSGTGFRP